MISILWTLSWSYLTKSVVIMVIDESWLPEIELFFSDFILEHCWEVMLIWSCVSCILATRHGWEGGLLCSSALLS